MLAWYILIFCRVVTGLVFACSGISKARDLAQFKQAILDFRLLPAQVSGPVAILFLCGEFAVVLFVATGGPLLFYGFILAGFLLCIFCIALASVLVRKMRTSCNCFGASDRPVTSTDLWRNAGFILCAVGGCGASLWARGVRENPGVVESLLVALGALVFVLIWVQLGEIAQLFRQS